MNEKITSKRKLIPVLLILICLTGYGSFSYFTAEGKVQNYFFSASSHSGSGGHHPSGGEFSITVYETDLTKTDGSKTNKGNTYYDIAPNDVLKKDPVVMNTGVYDAWVTAEVTFSHYSVWKKALRGNRGPETVLEGVDFSRWVLDEFAEVDEQEDTITYRYTLKNKLVPGESAKLFEAVHIPAYFDSNTMQQLSKFVIRIKGAAKSAPN